MIFTPWLNGERTPVDDHTIRAGWHNVSLRTDRADLVRAVLEGVAHNSRWLLDSVEKFCGRPFEWLNVVGGGGRSAAWAQIHADVLDRPIRRVENPIRANARGAALLAGLALGRLDVDELDEKVTVVDDPRARSPPTGHATTRRTRAFRSIYSKNKGIHRRLNGRRPSRMSPERWTMTAATSSTQSEADEAAAERGGIACTPTATGSSGTTDCRGRAATAPTSSTRCARCERTRRSVGPTASRREACTTATPSTSRS